MVRMAFPFKNKDLESIAAACELLEEIPSLALLEIYTVVGNHEVSIDASLHVKCGERVIEVKDRLFDVAVWRRFGGAVRNGNNLRGIAVGTRLMRSERSVDDGGNVINHELVRAAELCTHAFFAEVKHNKSIRRAGIGLKGVSMDDSIQFIQDNQALKTLCLESGAEPVSLEQSTALSRAIGNARLETISIAYCGFENDGSFEQMLEGCTRMNMEGCTRMNKLQVKVTCKNNSQCTAVAALLRDPAKVVRHLEVSLKPDGLDHEQAAREILTSLVGNAHLRKFEAKGIRGIDCFDSDKLLCDTSSIESISNSNHTLVSILVSGHTPSAITQQCLRLNENENKAKVVHDKIAKFYFVREFDVSPFVSMHLSVLPEVMSQIEGNGKQSAVYRLLQCIPELCNISNRVSSEQPGNKRRKMGSVCNSSN